MKLLLGVMGLMIGVQMICLGAWMERTARLEDRVEKLQVEVKLYDKYNQVAIDYMLSLCASKVELDHIQVEDGGIVNHSSGGGKER